ncbi:MAG: hypothetical protein MUF43_07110 [Flavobacterium sp.]|nr:hypothetical protein [Flavobacterium sp.]
MEQNFRYKKRVIEEVMAGFHDIHSIDISNSIKLRNTIENIVQFLELETLISVASAESRSINSYVDFSLKSTEPTSKIEFHDAIKKFQKHLESVSYSIDIARPEDIIKEIEKFISNLPKNHDIYFGLTHRDENETKIDCDLPTFWLYKTLPEGTGVTIFRYFIRKGYQNHHYPTGGADNIYLFAAPPKTPNPQKVTGCLLLSAIMVSMIFGMVYLFL